jgi:hypothetical protein
MTGDIDMFTPQDLKQILSSGLLSFPITDFDAAGDFVPKTYADSSGWPRMARPPSSSPAARANFSR